MAKTSNKGDLTRLLTNVQFQATRRLAKLLESEGVSLEEWRVIDLLSDGLGHPMTEVGEAILMPPATVTRLIDRMVADNVVHRRADEWDRRRLLVFMTDRGKQLHRSIVPRVAEHEGVLAEPLGGDAQVLQDLLTLLSIRLAD